MQVSLWSEDNLGSLCKYAGFTLGECHSVSQEPGQPAMATSSLKWVFTGLADCPSHPGPSCHLKWSSPAFNPLWLSFPGSLSSAVYLLPPFFCQVLLFCLVPAPLALSCPSSLLSSFSLNSSLAVPAPSGLSSASFLLLLSPSFLLSPPRLFSAPYS